MRAKTAITIAVGVGFQFFCVGAIMAQHLTKAGYDTLAFRMGIPVLIIQILLQLAIFKFGPNE